MKRIITAAGAAYILLCIWGALMFTSCSTTQHCDAYGSVKWEDNIHNPDNEEFVDEVAFNEGVASDAVTQQMFDARY
jgi:hypothetical protein